MPAYCITIHIHQPCRLRHYSFFDIGALPDYEDESLTGEIFSKAADELVTPFLTFLLKRISEYQGDFRIALSLSGMFLDGCERRHPRVLDLLKSLAGTGSVEFLGSPYYHSLASTVSLQEFKEQIILHSERLVSLLGRAPTAFANTGLIYSDAIARAVGTMGFKAILAGSTGLLSEKQFPSHIYHPDPSADLKVLPNHVFEPAALGQPQPRGKVHSLFLSLPLSMGGARLTETLAALDLLPKAILTRGKGSSLTPSEAAGTHKASAILSRPEIHSLLPPHDLTAWLGNEMQKDAFEALYLVEENVKRLHDPALTRTWRMLHDDAHFLAMSTRPHVESVAGSYGSPYDAYINFMNILTDLVERIGAPT